MTKRNKYILAALMTSFAISATACQTATPTDTIRTEETSSTTESISEATEETTTEATTEEETTAQIELNTSYSVIKQGGNYVMTEIALDDAEIDLSVMYTWNPFTVIAAGAFSDLNAEVIYIPEGVTTIYAAAFTNCQNLRELHLPSTVKRVDKGFLRLSSCPNVVVYTVENSSAWTACVEAGIPVSAEPSTEQ